MAKPRKDQDMEETKRIMERLVNTPHKPQKPLNELQPKKPESGYKKGRRPVGTGRRLPTKD
jgi:hypothetical protein